MTNPRHGLLFVISAPSGAGKTSLVSALIDRVDGLGVCVSHTTRPRRSKETDAINYHFVSTETFEEMIRNDAFLEHADVFGNYYGTALATVEQARRQGQDLILEIDWQGAAQVRRLIGDAISVFILPPSRAALEERLRGRGQDAPDIIERRLSQAVEEMSHHGDFDYLVVNDVFDTALDDLTAIVRAERLRRRPQQQALGARLEDLLDTAGTFQ